MTVPASAPTALQAAIRRVAFGDSLDAELATDAFGIIMRGEATAAQIAALLIGLRVKGETAEEVTGAARALRGAMVRLSVAAADDLVLRRIAQAGFSGLSNMINGTPDAPSTVPGLRGPAVASVIPEAPAAEMPASALGYAEQ